MSSNIEESTRAVRMQQWISTVQDCKASGKSNVTYCSEQGINIKTFYYWQKKLHREAAGKLEQRKPMLAKSSKEIVPVDFLATHCGEIIIRKAEYTVEISSGTSPATIEAVLSALNQQC